MKNIFSKTMRIARGTAMFVGAAVMLAVVLGVGSTALAAKGTPLILGKNNVAKALTTLTNRGVGPALNLVVRSGEAPMKVNSSVKVANLNADTLDGNDSSDFLATNGKAADAVHADEADLANTAANATNAEDADALDGKDASAFVGSSYFVRATVDNSATSHTEHSLRCDAGDLILSGGYYGLDPEDGTVVANNPGRTGFSDGSVRDTWLVAWKNASPSLDSNVIITAFCADLGEPHA